jgi:hypothetical protein
MIPNELTQLHQWMTWNYIDGAKVPAGKSNDPATWKAFEVVRNLPRKAFVFLADDPYCGVDLDDCIDDGEIAEWAMNIVNRFHGIAYCEISPSETGLKLITRAKKPTGSRCSNGQGVECYDHARFWTMTERVLGTMTTIGDGQTAIDWLCAEFLKQPDIGIPISGPKPLATLLAQRATGNATNILQRATAYVEALSVGVPGDLRNAAFRNAGHLHSIVGEYGERLSIDDVYGFLQMWNSRNPQQLKDKELYDAAKNAAKNGTLPADKLPEVRTVDSEDFSDVDLTAILRGWNDIGKADDEEFALSMIPTVGLMHEVVKFYRSVAFIESNMLALAIVVSFCQMIFGRRVMSSSGLRTNDYNIVLAGTGTGKEFCETTITMILESAGEESFMIPPDVQSGNGLLKALSVSPSSIWVSDEFGKLLEAVFDKKGNTHLKTVGSNLLKLYGKSEGTYGGAAHADGVRNRIVQPNLTLIGLATPSSVFDYLSPASVSDGLFGRIAWWPVQEKPEGKVNFKKGKCPDSLGASVKAWLNWYPSSGNMGAVNPTPVEICCTQEAQARWDSHQKEIRNRMSNEAESKAAIWSRVAARSMKLALVKRLSAIETLPGETNFDEVQIEIDDMEWAIKLANWLANISCGLALEAFGNRSLGKATAILRHAVSDGPKSRRDLTRMHRTVNAGDFHEAAIQLGLVIEAKGRNQFIYSQLS